MSARRLRHRNEWAGADEHNYTAVRLHASLLTVIGCILGGLALGLHTLSDHPVAYVGVGLLGLLAISTLPAIGESLTEAADIRRAYRLDHS